MGKNMRFSKEHNEMRKQVFNAVRKGWSLRSFGNSKAVRQAKEDAKRRVTYSPSTLTERDIFTQRMKEKAEQMAACLPDSGYRMGEMKYIHVPSLNFYAPYDNTKEYARSCQWKAQHGAVTVDLPARLVYEAENLSGNIIIKGKQVQKGIYRCQRVVFECEYSRRKVVEITWHLEKGFVVRREEGLRYFAGWTFSENIEGAKKLKAIFAADQKKWKEYKKRK